MSALTQSQIDTLAEGWKLKVAGQAQYEYHRMSEIAKLISEENWDEVKVQLTFGKDKYVVHTLALDIFYLMLQSALGRRVPEEEAVGDLSEQDMLFLENKYNEFAPTVPVIIANLESLLTFLNSGNTGPEFILLFDTTKLLTHELFVKEQAWTHHFQALAYEQ
jgi:hypothetical protein